MAQASADLAAELARKKQQEAWDHEEKALQRLREREVQRRALLAKARSDATSKCFRKVPKGALFVSEPTPSWFGNGSNDENNANWTNGNWLMSRFHFSFAEYKSYSNMNFGCLRVMNDDIVQPARGFGEHPHREAEICTYIVEGELTHADSMGNEETLGRGSVQFITAGTGITIWMTPSEPKLKPNYGSMRGDSEEATAARQNAWAHLVSGVGNAAATPVKINQDANIMVAEMEAGTSLPLRLDASRQAYLLCVEGSAVAALQGADTDSSEREWILEQCDAAELVGPAAWKLTAGEGGAHVLLVEMKGEGEDSRYNPREDSDESEDDEYGPI